MDFVSVSPHWKLSLLLFLLSACVVLAVPMRDFSETARAFQRKEDEKQLWLKFDTKKEQKGDFGARLQKEAAAGDAASQALLGVCYHIGFGVPRDNSKAIEWYQKAAAAGHAGAQNNLASLYDAGEGVPVDHEKAQQLYLMSANLGFAEAQFNVGWNFAHGMAVAQDWGQAKAWYEKATAQGYLPAQTNLGNLYVLGRGMPIDYEKAKELLQKPAEAGLRPAQFSLAVAYEGLKNPTEAVSWFHRSAEGGNATGQLFWAAALAEGHGVAKDIPEAIKWARKAAAATPPQIDPEVPLKAHCLVARLLLGVGPSVPAGCGAEAFRQASAAAEGGYADGQHLVGICYHRGAGVERNLSTAAKWYRMAAGQKHVIAASSLGSMLENGNGVPRDLTEAAKWYRVAAEGGDPLSQYRLGVFLRDGTGVESNLAEAAKWLRLASPSFPNDFDLKFAIDGVERLQKKEVADETYKNGIEKARLAAEAHGSMEEAYGLLNQAADLGQPFAMAQLAGFYLKGQGVPVDAARGEALVAKLERNHDPAVQYLLATACLPAGPAPNPWYSDRAVTFFRRSALQGNHPAQNAYGYYFMSAADGHQDLVEAFKWLTLSAAQGNNVARANLDHLRPTLSPAQIDEGTRRANEFHPTPE
ncbi:MAG: tetratricopeptide repeat protein [Chthoniobacter sp.]